MWQLTCGLLISVIGITAITVLPIKAAELSRTDLVITAFQSLGEVFIDGQAVVLTNANNWSLTDRIVLPPMGRLIALKAIFASGSPCAGVLASVNDTYLVTNNQWKCSPDGYPGWTDLGYDDSSWLSAVEYGSNSNHISCTEQIQFTDISSSAQWIWTNELTAFAVYCRGYLPLCDTASPCLNEGTCLPNHNKMCDCLPQFTGTYCESKLIDGALFITAYQQLQLLYVDGIGQPLINGNISNQPDRIQLTETNRLIAVKAAGDRTCGGLLASIGNTYGLTNGTWRCYEYTNKDWEQLGYDDSWWPYAVEFGTNADGHTECSQPQFIQDMSVDAKWIWVPDQTEFEIFCRGYIPVCDSSPCQSNGTCLPNNPKLCKCTPQFTGTYCETELIDGTLFITAYQQLQLVYIDGIEQPLINGNISNQPDRVQLTETNRLIAVRAAGDGTCGGLLASFGDAYVLTDGTWKCNEYQYENWNKLGYNDDFWLSAVELGSNADGHTTCSHLQFMPDISDYAKWIWVSNPMEYEIFCRGYTSFCDTAPCQNNGTCLRNNVKLCNCSPQFTGTYCEMGIMSLSITAKTTLYELYVDGVSQSLLHGNNVSAVDDILLPSYGRLIAVTAIDTTFTCAGILASVTGDYIVTDSSWKCHMENLPQWYTLGFDDLNWTNAYVIGPNNNVTWPPECSILNEVSTISQKASWIWTPTIGNTPYYDDIIYCRAYLPFCEQNSPCKNGGTCNTNSVNLCTCLHGYTGVFCESGRNLSISAKSAVQELYVDGVRINLIHGNNWTVADEIKLSNANRLISVYAVDLTSTCAGILASVTDDYLVTDSKWKCTTITTPQWYSLGFDDTDWVEAYVIGPNGNVSWPESCKVLKEIPAISQNAYWIWTSTILNAPYYDPVIYCRAYLPICERESPCQNGGTCNENNVNLCACAPGFTGVNCESVACEGDAPCQNGGTCNQESDALCQCPPAFTGIFCEFKVNRTITLTAKSIVYELFIDGVLTDLIHATNWTIPDEVTLSPLSRLIGITAMDGTETCAGIIASVTGDYLVTDGINWRCDYITDPQWFLLGWDDSGWDIAYVVGPNHNVTWPPACQILTGISSISPAANWIWTNTIPDTPYYHQRIYCRGYLPLCELKSPCLNGGTCNKNNQTLCSCLVGYIGEFCETVDSKLLAVTAKEVIESLYVDGVQVALQNGSDWLQTDNISIRSVSRLVALVAHQLDSSCVGPGILASVTDSRGDYVITDASWKCSPLAENGWNDLGYDDSTWQPAKLVKANNGLEVREVQGNRCYEVPIIPSISPDAFWIWTASDEVGAYDVLVYCRGYLPICDVHPCINGGTCNRNSNALCTCPSGYTGIYCENAVLNHDAEELQRSVLDETSDDTQSGRPTRPT